MYGTDWNLLIGQGNIEAYFANFTNALEEIDREPLPANRLTASQRFFGYNAVEWLGLRRGPARDRLDAFYRKNQIGGTPPWLDKLNRDQFAPT
jgi:hypothetical protein